MKNTWLLSVVLTSLWLTACSSTPTRVDKGPVKAQTFSFINGGVAPTAEFADKRKAVHQTIQDAITKNLASKGIAKVASGGDVTVAYLVIIGNNATTEHINTYFGYGGDAVALSDKAHDAYTGSKNPNYFEAGTLLIDVIDARTFKVLKRNYVVRPILSKPTAEVRAANIQSAVNEVLEDLRVAK
jgi:hypothetical protein